MHSFRLTTAALAALGIIALGSSLAFAQPGAAPPPPTYTPGTPGYYAAPPPHHESAFFDRRGLTVGFGFGFGNMATDSGPIGCSDCSYTPLAGAVDFHIGGMLSPRLAVLLEIWGVIRPLDSQGFESLQQTAMMVAAQYWLSPKLWLKGGIGAAVLELTYDDGYDSEPLDDGGAIMGALGYEIVAGPRFGIDLQLRLGTGAYEGGEIHAINGALGINWY